MENRVDLLQDAGKAPKLCKDPGRLHSKVPPHLGQKHPVKEKGLTIGSEGEIPLSHSLHEERKGQ